MAEIGKVTPGSTVIRRVPREQPHSNDKGRQQEEEEPKEEQGENSEHDEEKNNNNNDPGEGHIDVFT